MITVFVLQIVCANVGFFGPIDIKTNAIVFQEASRCLRNTELLRESLKKDCNTLLELRCKEEEVLEGKATR